METKSNEKLVLICAATLQIAGDFARSKNFSAEVCSSHWQYPWA